MKIASWNVNSIRARQARVLAWVEKIQPDVLCLQELKTEDALFPAEAFLALGYHSAVHGQRTYNGVAILSRSTPVDVARGFLPGTAGADDPQARLIAATLDGVRVICAYVPNGESLGSDKYAYKLRWLGQLRNHLHAAARPEGLTALCGDFNVAPEARDVYDPALFERDVLFHTDARSALAGVCEGGLVDTFRIHHPEPGLYSWWDYRMLAFPKNRGVRIDFILASRALAARCTAAGIDREARKGALPSDHAPVVADFEL